MSVTTILIALIVVAVLLLGIIIMKQVIFTTYRTYLTMHHLQLHIDILVKSQISRLY